MPKPPPPPPSDTTIRVSRRTIAFLESMEELRLEMENLEASLSGRLFAPVRWTHEAMICWLASGGSEAELRRRIRGAKRLIERRDAKCRAQNGLPPDPAT